LRRGLPSRDTAALMGRPPAAASPGRARPALRLWPVRVAVAVVLSASVLLPASAPATVAEQRARLPPPATCVDPIEGIWRAHYNDPKRYAWREWTLEIRRTKGSESGIEGTITNHGWNGGPDRQQPGPCTADLDRWQIKMDARGTYRDGQVIFGGTRWWLDQQICGHRVWGPGAYNVDTFSGTVDAALQEFQSVGNDGAVLVDAAMVFRRIHCFDQDAPDASVTLPLGPVIPPELFPRRRAPSCCSSTEP
jgi:hypothetical protein